jgi:hypothetical protein
MKKVLFTLFILVLKNAFSAEVDLHSLPVEREHYWPEEMLQDVLANPRYISKLLQGSAAMVGAIDYTTETEVKKWLRIGSYSGIISYIKKSSQENRPIVTNDGGVLGFYFCKAYELRGKNTDKDCRAL